MFSEERLSTGIQTAPNGPCNKIVNLDATVVFYGFLRYVALPVSISMYCKKQLSSLKYYRVQPTQYVTNKTGIFKEFSIRLVFEYQSVHR